MARLPAGPARFLTSKHLIAVLLAASIVALSAAGYAWAAKDSVTVVVDGESMQVRTNAPDVGSLLRDAGVSVEEGDHVTPDPDTVFDDGAVVTVRHAMPVVLELADDSLELDVIGTTVADVLVSVGLDPGSGLAVSPSIDTPLEPGMTVKATDVFVRVVQEEEEIPFETLEVEDPELLVGREEVREEGTPGSLLRIFETLVTDGAEGVRALQAERVLAAPVARVVAVGTRRPVARVTASRGTPRTTGPAPADGEGTRLTVATTAYTPGYGCGYSTATGARAGYGVVAVDPSVIALGTRMYIPGYGYGVASDTGGSIRGNKIDVCFDTLSEARAWGRRTVTITLLP